MNTRYYLKVPVKIGAPGVQPGPLLPEDAVAMGLDPDRVLIPAGMEIASGMYRKENNGLCVKVRVPGLDAPRLVLIGWLFLNARTGE